MSEQVQSHLMAVMTHPHAVEMLSTARMEDDFWPEPSSWKASLRPYTVRDGVLQIPVKGVLLNDFPYAFGGYATGYEYIQRALSRGLTDASVRAIAFIIDSPGGMVAGNQDCVDKIFAARGTKPMRAFAHEMAYSAAYNVACGPDTIVVSRSGGVGSIGVVTSHTDVSGMLEQRGMKITFIFAGKHKVDGNPTEPLPDDVKARIQVRIDELYSVFVSSVARGRGLDEQTVRDTEALTFTATQATSNGLADSIGSLDDAVSAFVDFLDDESNNDDGDDGMTTPTTVDQATHDTAVATARTEAAAAATTSERERIKAISTCDEATGRDALAAHIAFNTSMSVDDAKGMLAASPKAADTTASTTTTDAAGTTFANAMDGTPNPQVGADATAGGGGGDDAAASADPVLALCRAAGLSGFGASTPKK